jgi:hypothetical protein
MNPRLIYIKRSENDSKSSLAQRYTFSFNNSEANGGKEEISHYFRIELVY